MGPPTIALVQDPPPPGAVENQQLNYLPVPVTSGLSGYLGSMSSGSSVRGDSRSNSPYPESSRQTSSRSSSVQPYPINYNSLIEWSADRQNTFNMRLGRLMASAGLPMSWIENPEFILFCQEFIHPGASILGRKALSRRILPAIRRDFQKRAQEEIEKGALATIQSDGWSAINEHHLNAFMMTVERKVHGALHIIVRSTNLGPWTCRCTPYVSTTRQMRAKPQKSSSHSWNRSSLKLRPNGR